ncbi:MAG: hypothetical protein IPL10_19710 [Bacteroidetes bacterium]|jgi:hypothetical protein|nr:hypothetical protein [Bacteroidota bacterium]
MKKSHLTLAFLIIIFSMKSFAQQASLTIENKSNRMLTVKVMKGNERKNVLFKTDSVAPKSKQVVYFTETGFYFTKCQAVLYSKEDPKMNDTLFSKERPFQVISDPKRGYSNITMKYVIKESKKSEPDNAVPITRKEYAQ